MVGIAYGRAELPDRETLLAFLRGLDLGDATGQIVLAERESLLKGTHPKEIVTCRFPDGRHFKLLCKYGATSESHHAHGHRSGVRFERQVYEEALEPLGIPSPRRFEFRGENPAYESWLALEFLDGSEKISATAGKSPLEPAARLAARLHAAPAAWNSGSLRLNLKSYDREYFRGWARRSVQFIKSSSIYSAGLDWIKVLDSRSDDWVGPLLVGPQVLIHGEFYPQNILSWNGEAYAIDWESAALGPGEVDLAALTEGWDEQSVFQILQVYRRARWPGGPPHGHGAALAAAHIYLQLRWLGDRQEWVTRDILEVRVPRLRAAAQELGLV